MDSSALEIFATAATNRGTITAADVLTMRRDILPDGIADRDEANILIAIDRAASDAHPAWAAYLIPTLVDFVLWQSRPTGIVDEEAARWLLTSLSGGRSPTAAAEAIAFELVCEAERVDPALTAFALRSTRGRFAAMGLGATSPVVA